ncbi:MAG: hypothetical protein QOF43_1796 [Gaiellaceae bacterium]|jgi:hypothetical protein|nr:hypothetical protein [Gaiellaceae bacterium]
MQYALLIYGEECAWDARSADELSTLHAEYGTLTSDLRSQGKLVGGEELQPTATATTVQVRNGDTIVVDGPFAETKEALGGFYLVEADSLDEALEWAGRIPDARTGKIEVRPVVDHSEPAA